MVGFTRVANTCAVSATRGKHVDGCSVFGEFVGVVGSVVGGVGQVGSEAWWMVLGSHLSCGCVVPGASEEEQFVEWVGGCAERQEGRGWGIEGRSARRVEGHVFDVPVIGVVKWGDPKERVEEPFAEPLPGFAEYCVTTTAEAQQSKNLLMVVKFGLTESEGYVSALGR